MLRESHKNQIRLKYYRFAKTSNRKAHIIGSGEVVIHWLFGNIRSDAYTLHQVWETIKRTLNKLCFDG